MQVIKAYNKLTEAKKEVAFDDDRAVAEFRGFQEPALVHIDRVSTHDSIDVLIEVVETLRDKVMARKGQLA